MKVKISLACAALFLLAAGLVSAAIPPAQDLLPSDTLLMFTVPDFSALRASARQSPQWLLWNDPAMKPFRDNFTAKWDNKFLAPLEQSLGLKMADYVPLLQGQLTFALTQNGWNGTGAAAPAMLVLLDAKDKSALLATNLAGLKQQWIDSGKTVQTKILEGIKFSVVSLSSNTPTPFGSFFPMSGAGHSPPNVYIGQYQSLLILGTSEAAVVSVAAHLNGGANPSLSQNAQFAADELAQFYRAPLYYGWFNAKAFLDGLSHVQIGQNTGPFPISWNDILLASGLGGLKSVSLTYRETHAGAEVELYAAAPASARRGLLKMVAAAPKEANPPPFVPVSATKFWRWRVDGQKSWDELQRTLTAISPTALMSLNSFIQIANATGQQEDPGFDVRKDLIDNLGDDWMSYSMAPAGNTLAAVDAAPWLFLFSAKNADQAVLAIKTVATMAAQGAPSQTRDFLGRKIYTIPLPGQNGALSRSFYCTASGGYVAVTTDVSMIENFLRSDDGKTKPLSRKPGLAAAAQEVGGMDNGFFGYQNQSESARELFLALKNEPAQGAAAVNPLAMMPFSGTAIGIQDMMNFSLLPDYGQVSKYFNFTVYGGSTTSEGLDFKLFQPRSPELN